MATFQLRLRRKRDPPLDPGERLDKGYLPAATGAAQAGADERVKIFRAEDFAYHKVSVVFWQFDEHDQPAIVTEPIIRWQDSPQLGYEILPNKYFYRYQPPTPAKELLAEFWRLEKEAEEMLKRLAE